MSQIQLGTLQIGDGCPPVFWPDIDVYFKQDMAKGLRLVDEIAKAGGRFVKGAVLHRADLCLNCDETTEYFVPGEGKRSESYRKIIERHVVPLETLAKIFRRVKEAGLELVLSVYDSEGIEFALDTGAVAIKIPSSNIVHAPLIRQAARQHQPLVLDTGRADLAEILRAIQWAREAGAEQLIVQHSPPGPPAPARDFHLRMMPELGRLAGALYGLSDHFMGEDMLLLAVALGAHVIEKGVCAEDARADIDLAHALPIDRFAATLRRVRVAYEALGERQRKLPEDRPAPKDRMGLIAACDIAVGDELSARNVSFAFPNLGIPVEEWDACQGRTVCNAIRAGSPIRSQDLAE